MAINVLTPNIVVTVDRGVSGVGIDTITVDEIDNIYYLNVIYTNGTTELIEVPPLTEASVSAAEAAASASASATSASNAATSATNAANSATGASTSATTATTQAGIATTQASNAQGSAISATASASSATASASSATSSASSASSSATSATGSATTATTQAGIATSQATTATTQAGIATTQAGISTTQAGIATTKASEASASATSAASLYDQFDDRYLGSKTVAPTVDNDGNPLLTGALYFNSVTTNMNVWDGSAWYAAYISVDGYAPLANPAFTGVVTENGSQIVVQTDVGTAPNKIPLNQYLGSLAYQDLESVTIDGGVATLDTATITSIQNDTAISNVEPSLMLNFAQVKKLDPRITYARASTATYYDGVTNSKAEENLVLRSQEFDVGWVKLSTTVTANTATAPDGTTTADLLYPTTTGNSRIAYQILTLASATYTQSIFAKASGLNHLCIYQGGGTVGAAWFNLSTGAVGTVAGGFSATITSVGDSWYRCTVTFTGGANFSLTVGGVNADNSITATTSGLNGVLLWGAQTEQRSAVSSYTPTTTQPITRYQPTLLTAPSGVARFDHNPTTTESLGLLIEEQRTNLLTYSEDFSNAAWGKQDVTVISNTIVAPDGTLTGDKLVENTTNTFKDLRKSITLSAGTYTSSVVAKYAGRVLRLIVLNSGGGYVDCDFNLENGSMGTPFILGGGVTNASASISNIGNGMYRCTVTATHSSSLIFYLIRPVPSVGYVNSGVYTGDGYSGIFIWGAQLEAGAFPTSYIPTVASQVTRSADSAVITGSNFSSWYSQGQGSLYTESIVRSVSPTNNYAVVALLQTNGSANNRMSMLQGAGLSGFPLGYRLFVYANSVTQVVIDATSGMTANVPEKMAAIIENNDWVLVKGGNILGTSTVGRMDVPDRMYIGSSGIGTTSIYPLNGTIKKIAYFPARLSNEELQEMTS